jgi:hypothetical protein
MSRLSSIAAVAALLLSATVSQTAVAQTANCAAAATRANDNIALRVQQNTPGAENRESARVHVEMAGHAAATGNEAECWRQLNISGLFVGLPAGTLPQTGLAATPTGGAQGGGVQSGGGGE